MSTLVSRACKEMSTTESKIVFLRSRNPLQPVPFELFPEFCKSWNQDYCKDIEELLSELGEAKAQLVQLDQDPAKMKSKASVTNSRKQNKILEKVKLSGAMRLYGQISEDCIKLERGLKMIKEQLDCMEPAVKELEAIGDVLRKNAVKYSRPSAVKIAQKVAELELMEKELLNVEIDEEKFID